MSIRLTSMKFKNLGPIEQIEHDLDPLTVIYGHNEDGKTLLLEAISRWAFKQGAPGSDRTLACTGQIGVEGLGEGVLKKTTRPKIDELLNEKHGAPTTMSRLLTVRAGDVRLKQGDESSRSTLQTYLSSEATYGAVLGRISKTTQQAKIDDGVITGANRGELKERDGMAEDLRRLDRAFLQIDELASEAERASIRAEIEKLEYESKAQEKAGQHKAWQLNHEIQGGEAERKALPDDKVLTKIESHEDTIARLESRIAEKQASLDADQKPAAHAEWLKSALEDYQRVSNPPELQQERRTIWVECILILVAIAGLAGDLKWLAIGAIVALLGYVFFRGRSSGTDNSAAITLYEKERAFIGAQFEERFETALICEADIDSRLKEAEAGRIRSGTHVEDMRGMQNELGETRNTLKRLLDSIEYTDFDREKPSASIAAVHRAAVNIDTRIAELRMELGQLPITPDDYLKEDPRVEFVPDKQEKIRTEHEELTTDLAALDEGLGGLKDDLIGLVNGSSQDTMDSLIEKLRDRRVEIGDAYRRSTATIIAGILTTQALNELKATEDERLQKTLDGTRLPALIESLTGRAITLELEDDELIAVDPADDDDQRRPLHHLSTGTQEQILIALRMALAEHVAGEEGLFMLLDDAFQHSDWKRRPRLIKSLKDMVDTGWQVIYFTMDDHIRDEFSKVGAKLIDLADAAS